MTKKKLKRIRVELGYSFLSPANELINERATEVIQIETAKRMIEEIEKLIPTKNLYSEGKDISVERIIEVRERILMAELDRLKKKLINTS